MFNIYRLETLQKANMMFAFCFSVTLFFFVFAQAQSQTAVPDWNEVHRMAEEKKLADSVLWRRLGHYRCLGSSCSSEEDGPIFFFSPEGRDNPQAELTATIEAFKQNTERKFGGHLPAQTPQCQFPARLTWLARETGLYTAENLLRKCTELNDFRGRLDASGASLVFSSFYLNNPSSAFGHTLLKIQKGKNQHNTQADLLNYGIGYAANPTTNNPVLYAMMGLLGGFSGSYTSMPYYYKVREYNDFENRDLWEYELELSPEEIEMLVKHLWELGFTDFRYFYLSENCSYHLMALLDVAAPRLNLTEPLPYWVLPVDTVKAVANTPGLVKKINHRSSLANVLERRFATFDSGEREQFFAAIKTYDPKTSMSVKVFDAVIDHYDMNNGQLLLKKDKEATQQKHQLLVKRASLSEPMAELPADSSVAPHESHNSLRWEFSGGRRDHTDTFHFGIRFSLHDLTDPIGGLPPYARLEMFYGDFFYDGDKDRIRGDRFRFVGIEALNSWSTLWKRPAWRFDMGAERIQDERCFDCMTTTVGGSIGLSKSFSASSIQVAPFVYFNARVRGGKFVNDDFSPEVGPSVGVRALTKYDFNFTAEYESRTIWNDFQDEYNVVHAVAQKTFDKKWALRIQYDLSDRWEQARLGLLLFQ